MKSQFIRRLLKCQQLVKARAATKKQLKDSCNWPIELKKWWRREQLVQL
jgi:hypothetical protein